jgi:hypothetical protein
MLARISHAARLRNEKLGTTIRKRYLRSWAAFNLYFKPPSYALLLIKGVHEVTGLINKAEKDHDTSKNDKSGEGLASAKAEGRGRDVGK